MKRVFIGLIFSCLVLFSCLAEANVEVKKEWQACHSDTDCTAGVVCCDCWEAINKEHIKELVDIQNRCDGTCDAACLHQNQPETSCIDGQCTASYEFPRTKMSVQQWTDDHVKTSNNALVARADAVLEVNAFEKFNVCEKYCSQRVRILKVLVNKSDYIFPESIDVYFYSWKKEILKGRSVIYIKKYNSGRNDLWKLVEDTD